MVPDGCMAHKGQIPVRSLRGFGPEISIARWLERAARSPRGYQWRSCFCWGPSPSVRQGHRMESVTTVAQRYQVARDERGV